MLKTKNFGDAHSSTIKFRSTAIKIKFKEQRLKLI